MDANSERWEQLAALASREQDPNKLMELVREINALLEQKHGSAPNSPPAASA